MYVWRNPHVPVPKLGTTASESLQHMSSRSPYKGECKITQLIKQYSPCLEIGDTKRS